MEDNFTLLQPLWTLLLIPLWFWWRKRRREPPPWPQLLPVLAIRYPLLPALLRKNANPSTNRSNLPDLFLLSALILIVMALTQPVSYHVEIDPGRRTSAPDLILVVDTAVSMSLKDYVINDQSVDRMSITRRLLDSFVAGYPGEKTGLVILGNPPALWLPLTSDKNAVRDAIARIRTTLGGRLSDMGAALKLVSNNYPGTGDKIVVLISDGGLQLGETSPQDAASQLSATGFTLYVIAIGSQSGSSGESSDTTSLIYQPTDLTMMKKVANKGKGQLFQAEDTESFVEMLETIETRHSQPAPPAQEHKLYRAWHPIPLTGATILLLLASFMPGNFLAKPRGMI